MDEKDERDEEVEVEVTPHQRLPLSLPIIDYAYRCYQLIKSELESSLKQAAGLRLGFYGV